MKKTKKRLTPKKLLAFTLSAVMVLPLSSTAAFAEGTQADIVSDAEQTTPDIDISATNTVIPVSADVTDTNTDSSVLMDAADTTTGSSISIEEADTTTGSSISIEEADTTTGSSISGDTSDADTDTPSLICTKITVGSYIYKITSANTVTLKGFAPNVSATTVTVKNTISYNNVSYKVTKIGKAAFQGQTVIKKVIIRKNVTDIGQNAFYGCSNITKVSIRTGVTIIRKQAFMLCSKLKTVNITSTVLSAIKTKAFYNIKPGAVINVMNKSVKTLIKGSVPSTITVNKM